MHVLVTGGTGFVGRPLVRRLLDGGADVTILTRDPQRAAIAAPAGARLAAWSPPAALDPALLRGVDAIVNLAGEGIADARWSDARKRAIRDSRIDATRTLVDALLQVPDRARPRTLISASAVGAYGDRGDEELNEFSRPGTGFLAEVCRDWEAEAQRASRFGVRVSTVRIGVVLGRDGGALAKMVAPFRLGVGGRIGSGRQWMSWIHLDDLVAMILWALERRTLDGPINATAPGAVRNDEFTKTLGRTLGRPALIPAPAPALRIALGEMSAVLLASQRVHPTRAVAAGFEFRFPTLEATLTNLCRDAAHEVVYEQWFREPPERLFRFFSDPANLEAITPPFLRFKVLGASTPQLAEGTCIDYRLLLHGVPLRWRSRIETWTPPAGFVDRQLKGPYASWVHTHELVPHARGTLMRDRVRYELPLGALGDIVAGRWVAHDVDEIFAYRREKLAELFRCNARDADAATEDAATSSTDGEAA